MITKLTKQQTASPSVGVWHLEGVAQECNTVEKALNWRNNQWHTNAEILT